MTARERDVLVGRTFDERVRDYYERYGEEAFDAANFPRLGVVVSCPRYSTDIGAAWKVVEKVQVESGLSVSIERDFAGTWVALFMDDNHWIKSRGSSTNAPEAICLAALRATGVEV